MRAKGVREEQEGERDAQLRGREALRACLRERTFLARREAKERLARESLRLGRLEQDGNGAFSSAVRLREGSAMQALSERAIFRYAQASKQA